MLTQAQASTPGNAPVQVTYEYDAAGRRVAEVQAHHNRVWRISHELDALGHRSSTHIPDTGAITWQRYGSGHVHGVLLNSDVLANFERDELHREIQRVQGSVTHTLDYTPAGLLAHQQWQSARGQAKPWRSWEHDQAGGITQIQDAMRGTKRYSYDALSRLTDAGAEHFTYDAASNLVKTSRDGVQGRARGDRLDMLMLGQEPVQYGYDGHGNRTARTVGERTTRYHYDGMHQLDGVTLADGTKASYEYDAMGRRIAKHVTQNGETKTTLFVWDGDWLTQEISNGKTITYVKHPNHAGPLAKLESGKVYHYVTDHLGTPQEMHDAQGKVVWAAEYSAYGIIRKRMAHEVGNPIRFAGQYFDDGTGLHYNRFRYYDPQAGRYVNQDPIGLRGGLNQYAYVNGNPIRNIDPDGRQGCAPPANYGVVQPSTGSSLWDGFVNFINNLSGVSYPDRLCLKWQCKLPCGKTMIYNNTDFWGKDGKPWEPAVNSLSPACKCLEIYDPATGTSQDVIAPSNPVSTFVGGVGSWSDERDRLTLLGTKCR